jgi:putative DNA primase/helicase
MSVPDLLARLHARRCGSGWIALCPAHDDRKPSLSVHLGKDLRALLYCHAGCTFGSILRALNITDADLRAERPMGETRSREVRVRYTRRLWDDSRSIAGTIAETYLRTARGITLPLPRCLRFLPLLQHREYGWPFPCLAAGIQGPDGSFAGLSMTWLSADGSDKAPVEPVRKVFGVLRGGAVRLGAAGESLVLCEGVETGLSIAQACLELPVWSALSASNLPHVEIPESVRCVIIAADADERGEQAAQATAEKFLHEGLHVKIAKPAEGASDFNDVRQ